MNNCTIRVNLLNEFSISDGNITITQKDMSSQLCILLSYLVANKSAPISQDEFSTILWNVGVSNSSNALKNLVYRIRKLLEDYNFKFSKELIVSNRGSYRINQNLKLRVDTDSLVKLNFKAENETQDDKKEQYLTDIVEIYQGYFMKTLSHHDWVDTLRAEYHSIYLKSAYQLLNILAINEKYDELLSCANSVISIDKFAEEAHRYVMLAYYKTDKTGGALTYYKQTRELFYRELGVELSNATREFYNEISKTSKLTQVDIVNLNEEFMESKDEKKYSFYCELEVFKQIYRFNARALSRIGTSFYMALINITGIDGNDLELKTREKSMEYLYRSILDSIRKGDVFSRCSPTQYVIMLPAANYKNSSEILDRIVKSFKSNYHSRKINVIYNLKPLDPALDD